MHVPHLVNECEAARHVMQNVISTVHSQDSVILVAEPVVEGAVLGEGETTALELVSTLTRGGDPRSVAGIAWYDESTDRVVFTAPRAAIEDVDSIPFPAWDLVDIGLYARSEATSSMGRRLHMEIFTSRGCQIGRAHV